MVSALSERHGLVDSLLTPGGASQPHHAIRISLDMNASQTGEMFGGQLGLNLGSDSRVLHEYLGARADCIGVFGRHCGHRAEQCAEYQARDCKCCLHDLSLVS